MPTSPFEVRTLSDRLVEVVRNMILSGAIEPNVPIRQDALASELNVSKIPVREALVRLEQDGLVVSHPNRGFFVRAMSAAEAEEIYALRLKLEPDASAAASLAANDAERQAAIDILTRLDEAAAAQSPSVGPLNRAFHIALTQPGGQTLTAGIVTRLHVMADRYVRKHLESKGRHTTAALEHHDILEAWLARDPVGVRRMVAEHLEHTLHDLRQELSQIGPGLPVVADPVKGRRRAS